MSGNNHLIYINDNKNESASDYYKRMAGRIAIFKYILAAFIIIFSLFCFAKYRSEITIENFRYMIKFFDFSSDSNNLGSGKIIYERGNDYDVAAFRNSLAVADSTGVSVYDLNGQRLFSEKFSYSNPVLAASDKYLYAYDLGGNFLKIYNTYSELYSINTTHPIYGFASNSAGSFALITGYKNYRSAITMYNKDFNAIYTSYFGENYAVSVDINDKSNRMAALLTGVEEGEYYAMLSVADPSKEESVASLKFLGELPLKIQYKSDGTLLALTDKALRYYDDNLELKKEMFFYENSPTSYYFSDNCDIITSKLKTLGTETEINIYDTDGEIIRNLILDEKIKSKAIYGDNVYVLTFSKLYVLNMHDSSLDKQYPSSPANNKLFIYNNRLILASSSGAMVLEITQDGLSNPEKLEAELETKK